MIHLLQRIGFGGRALFPLVLVGIGVALFLMVRAAQADTAELQLVAQGYAGSYSADVRLAPPDSLRQADGDRLVPLVLAVYDAGPGDAHPDRLDLLLPARARLMPPDTTAGVRVEHVAGRPLVRYVFTGVVPPLKAGHTVRLAGLDTLWLDPAPPPIRCAFDDDSVPVFEATPREERVVSGTIPVYYALRGGTLARRSAGLLRLHVDSAVWARSAPASLPDFPATVYAPAVPWPTVDSMRLGGTARADCGPPEDLHPVTSTLWRTARGGRVLALSVGGAARKYLYDLDGDSVAELEIWDRDADGRFESEAQARVPLPAFLFPPRPTARERADSMRADSLRRAALADSLRVDSLTGGIRPVPRPAPPAGPDTSGARRPRPDTSGARRPRPDTAGGRRLPAPADTITFPATRRDTTPRRRLPPPTDTVTFPSARRPATPPDTSGRDTTEAAPRLRGSPGTAS